MANDGQDVPFIALLNPTMGGTEFEATRATLGCALLIHESATKETAPMVIAKLTMKAIDLVCACGNPQCTFKLRYRAEKSGHHPPYAHAE